MPTVWIKILKLHFDGKNNVEILNLAERKINRKGEEEDEEEEEELPPFLYPFSIKPMQGEI